LSVGRRGCDAVVPPGSYRLPPEVGGLLEAAYDDDDVGVGSVVDLALAHWHQEIFRSRIRERPASAPEPQKGRDHLGAAPLSEAKGRRRRRRCPPRR
jgi:hypothetical protein